MRVCWSVLVLSLAITSVSHAAIVGSFVEITSEASTSPPAGYRTFDLQVTTDQDWSRAELLVNTTAGSIYQDPAGNGSGLAPSPSAFSLMPALRFDTYVKGWNPLGGASEGFSSPSGATHLGGNVFPAFSTTTIDKAWTNSQTTDIGTSTLARITLSNDIAGTWKLRLYAGSDFTDSSGALPVPEPNAIALASLAIAAIALTTRGRLVLARSPQHS